MNVSHFVKTPEHKRCVQMLTEGFVESFVDFFYLTHKKDASSTDNAADSGTPTTPSVAETENGTVSLHDMPNDVLDFLMERLSEAEDSQRDGNVGGVVRAYRALAEHFEGTKDFSTAVHFHQKGLEASFRLGDSSHAADSYRRIGVDYEELGNIPLAIQYYDKYADIVQRDAQDKEAIVKSFRHLVAAYRTFAEQLEEKASVDGSEETLRSAVEYYKKCLAMAKNCSDASAEGTVNYRLGLVYKQLDKLDLSIKHLQNYLYICRLNSDTEGESAACSALADSFMSNNDILQSVKYLEENIALAQRTNQTVRQAHACRDLGVIYDQQEDYEKALEYFEKYFSLSLESRDRRLIDNARVYLGIARGNAKLMRMFNIANHSITPATMRPIPPASPNPARSGGSSRPRSSMLREGAASAQDGDGQAHRPRTPGSSHVESMESSRTPPRTPESERRSRSKGDERRPRSGDSERRARTSDKDHALRNSSSTPRADELADGQAQGAESYRSTTNSNTTTPRHTNSTGSPRSARAATADSEKRRPRTPPIVAQDAAHGEPLPAQRPRTSRGRTADANSPRNATAHQEDPRSNGRTPRSAHGDAGTPRRPRTAKAPLEEGAKSEKSETQGEKEEIPWWRQTSSSTETKEEKSESESERVEGDKENEKKVEEGKGEEKQESEKKEAETTEPVPWWSSASTTEENKGDEKGEKDEKQEENKGEEAEEKKEDSKEEDRPWWMAIKPIEETKEDVKGEGQQTESSTTEEKEQKEGTEVKEDSEAEEKKEDSKEEEKPWWMAIKPIEETKEEPVAEEKKEEPVVVEETKESEKEDVPWWRSSNTTTEEKEQKEEEGTEEQKEKEDSKVEEQQPWWMAIKPIETKEEEGQQTESEAEPKVTENAEEKKE